VAVLKVDPSIGELNTATMIALSGTSAFLAGGLVRTTTGRRPTVTTW
jgi:hypothetical protein